MSNSSPTVRWGSCLSSLMQTNLLYVVLSISISRMVQEAPELRSVTNYRLMTNSSPLFFRVAISNGIYVTVYQV